MTGFGRCEAADEKRKFTVEMKGVNHRYLDANIRMPKKLNFFESAIRSLLKESVHRGKVDIFITYEDFSESQVSLKYNETLAAEYLAKFKMMEEKFSLENDIRVSSLARFPEVFTMEEQAEDEDKLWNGLKDVKRFKGIFYWEPESEPARNGYALGAFNDGKPTIALSPFSKPAD